MDIRKKVLGVLRDPGFLVLAVVLGGMLLVLWMAAVRRPQLDQLGVPARATQLAPMVQVAPAVWADLTRSVGGVGQQVQLDPVRAIELVRSTYDGYPDPVLALRLRPEGLPAERLVIIAYLYLFRPDRLPRFRAEIAAGGGDDPTIKAILGSIPQK